MKLYFGNAVTTATTLMILALLGFIGWSAFHRANIQYFRRWFRYFDIPTHGHTSNGSRYS